MNDTSPAVTVVLDPGDDAAITRAALAAHDPAAGRVTVHPAPGTRSDLYFAHDVLAALGKPADLPGFTLSRAPVWEAATAWMAAIPVRRLTVLRAHLLTRERLRRLLDLRAFTGAHLVLVCHRARLTAALNDTLTDVPCTLTHARAGFFAESAESAEFANSVELAARGLDGPAARRRTDGGWITVPALDRLADWDGQERCTGCLPPPISWRYRPRPSPCSPRTTAEIAHRIHTVTAHPRLAAALAAAVFTGAAGQQLGTVRLADWDREASTLALHDPAGEVDGCATHPVPAWAALFLDAAVHFTPLAPVPGLPLLIGPEEHPALLRLAEQARLRPPQPDTDNASDAVSVRGVEWFYRQLKETGLDSEAPQPVRRPRLRGRRAENPSAAAP
ncbi:hypothetical protein AB0I68_38570 [Streptomyces sp. NPDC050448]|uniref:hypothetical protein n=1 Tax=Streptomyces sp. NPDC050448 TaxID=3155404 RepID=UPI00344A4AC6